jgi:hypothetical protein
LLSGLKVLAILAICALVGLLSQGCASTVRELEDKNLAPSKSVPVIGAVRLLNALEPISLQSSGSHTLTIALDDSQKTIIKIYALNSKDHFVWHLPPGQYRVLYYKYASADFFLGDSWLNKRLWLSFHVPADADSVYVGTLSINVQSALGQGVSIVDELPATMGKLNGELVVNVNKVFKSILTQETIR